MENSNDDYMTREQILKLKGIRYDSVFIEGYGKVRIRSLSELDRSEFEKSMLNSKCEVDKRRIVEMRRRLIVMCSVDKNGNQLFTRADLEELESVDGKFTGHLCDRIEQHTGIKIDRDLIKNSEETKGDASA